MKKCAAFIFSLVLITLLACGGQTRKGVSNEDTTVEDGVSITPLEIHQVHKLDEQGSGSPALTIDISLSLIETGDEERIYDRMDYEEGRGTSFLKGADGDCDNVTVGINKAARKEKVRKAIQDSKRQKAKRKAVKRK